MLFLFVVLLSATVVAADILPGPIPAQVLRVIDGDTVEVDALIWHGQRVKVSVRIAGIDAPELHGVCVAETTLANQARDFVAANIGTAVSLLEVKPDKYAGRVDAALRLSDGRDLGTMLIVAGLARPYAGGARQGWCP